MNRRKPPRERLHSNYKSLEEEVGASCAEEVLKVKIFPNTDRYFQIGTSMKDRDKVEMLLFLL